ncbi:MAG: hypothetical protein EOO41_04260 [Methanobacteriota archaeon]|nr:MAG: hypothetical protein EOO41_04260 [Euryarchaeota archaeon]
MPCLSRSLSVAPAGALLLDARVAAIERGCTMLQQRAAAQHSAAMGVEDVYSEWLDDATVQLLQLLDAAAATAAAVGSANRDATATT